MKNISKLTFLTALLLTSVSMAQSTSLPICGNVITDVCKGQATDGPEYFVGHGIGLSGDQNSGSTMNTVSRWLSTAASKVSNNSYTQSDNIYNQSLKLQDNINKNGTPGVPKILVGYSMGGLRARSYLQLTNDLSKPDVKGLITIDTPHNGAPIMNNASPFVSSLLFDFNRSLNGFNIGPLEILRSSSNFWISLLGNGVSVFTYTGEVVSKILLGADLGNIVAAYASGGQADVNLGISPIDITFDLNSGLNINVSPIVYLSQSKGTKEDLTPNSNFLKAINNLQDCRWVTETVYKWIWFKLRIENIRKQICKGTGSMGTKIPAHVKTMSIRGTGNYITDAFDGAKQARDIGGPTFAGIAILNFASAWTCWGCTLPGAWSAASLSYTLFNINDEWKYRVTGSGEGDTIVPLKNQDMYGFVTPAQIGGTPAISINGQPNAGASAKDVKGAVHTGNGGVLENPLTQNPIAEYQRVLGLPVIKPD